MTTTETRPAPPATVPLDDHIGTPVDPLGAPLDRLDGYAKTHGRARYSADHHLDDMVFAAPVHAAVARGRIIAIDTAAAEALPGVLAVITHTNAPATKKTPRPGFTSPGRQAASSSADLLRTDEVFYDGQPVAVVVAESIDIAQQAAALVQVTIAATTADVDFDRARRGPTDKLSAPPILSVRGKKGDADRELASAAVVIDREYTTPEYTHNAIEPHATTAAWDGDHLTVYEGTQNIDGVADHLAKRFDVPKANVRVLSPFVGGAFGGKSHVWPATFLTVLAARTVGRPVHMALSRASVYRTVGGRTASWQRVAIGARRDGTFQAIVHDATSRLGSTGGHPEQITSCTHDMYAADAIRHDQRSVTLDLVPNTYMRAPGESIGTFALESTIDEMATTLGIDPVSLRLANQPTVAPVSGNRFTHHRTGELLRLGAERFGWADRSPDVRSMRDGNHLVGWGVACGIHPAMRANANLTMSVTADGTVTVRCAFHEMGMGSATAVAQMTAHLLGVPVGRIAVLYGDSDLPTGPAAGASVQTASIAASLERAADALRSAATDVARRHADDLGLRGSALTDAAGGVGDGTRTVGFGELAGRHDDRELTVSVGHDTGWRSLLDQGRMVTRLLREGRSIARAATAAQFCEVRIDADTGELRIARWLGVFDIGTVVNAKTAASQLRGGIVMGIGMTLFEATQFDPRTGRIANPSLTEYHLPVHADVPRIDIEMLDDPDPSMPLGVVGAGEVGVTGVAAALASAIHHATGRRHRTLPITLDQIVPD